MEPTAGGIDWPDPHVLFNGIDPFKNGAIIRVLASAIDGTILELGRMPSVGSACQCSMGYSCSLVVQSVSFPSIYFVSEPESSDASRTSAAAYWALKCSRYCCYISLDSRLVVRTISFILPCKASCRGAVISNIEWGGPFK